MRRRVDLPQPDGPISAVNDPGAVDRGDHGAQVGGHRLLPGEQVDRQGVELGADCVELLVGRDDALRQVHVGVEESGRRAGHGRAGQPGHLDQLVRDLVEVVVEGVAHAVLVRWWGGLASARFARTGERTPPPR